MSFDRLWADWRASYVAGATASSRAGGAAACVFCSLSAETPSAASGVLYEDATSFCVLNAFPYGSGHLLVLPKRHESSLLGLDEHEQAGLWRTAVAAVGAVERAYGPDGMNVGANLGEAAGAGIPAHLHLHVLPRWNGDTNFMTSIGETRVLPESLASAWEKLSQSW